MSTRFAAHDRPMACLRPDQRHSPTMRSHPLDRVASLGFITYAASATVTPICLVALSRSLGLSLSQGGFLEALRNVMIVLMLGISGPLAARWGKVLTLGVGAITLGIGGLCYAIGVGYAGVLVALGMVGIGGGIMEALINPLVQDLHPQDSGRHLNRINAFWSLGVPLTVLSGGELLTIGVHWRVIVAAMGLLGILTGIAFLRRIRNLREPRHRARSALGHKWTVLRQRRFWVFAVMMLLAGMMEGGFTFWSASYIQLHLDGLPRAGGFATACFAGGMMLGRFASGWLLRQQHIAALLLISSLGGLGFALLVPWASNTGQVMFLLLGAGLAVACMWPSLQSFAADRLQTNTTALFILLSAAGIPGFALSAWLLGVLGDQVGLQMAWHVMPPLFVLMAILVAWEGRLSRQQDNNDHAPRPNQHAL